MRYDALAAVLIAAALAAPSAVASDSRRIERIADIVAEVCFAHGGDAEAVAEIANERHWAPLTDEEVERLDWLLNRPAHLAAWWAERGDQPIMLTMGWGEYH